MCAKRNKYLLLMATVTIFMILYHFNMESYHEQRLHMMINDFLLSW